MNYSIKTFPCTFLKKQFTQTLNNILHIVCQIFHDIRSENFVRNQTIYLVDVSLLSRRLSV